MILLQPFPTWEMITLAHCSGQRPHSWLFSLLLYPVHTSIILSLPTASVATSTTRAPCLLSPGSEPSNWLLPPCFTSLMSPAGSPNDPFKGWDWSPDHLHQYTPGACLLLQDKIWSPWPELQIYLLCPMATLTKSQATTLSFLGLQASPSLRKSSTWLPPCLCIYYSFCLENHYLGREHPEHRWDSETRRAQSLRETYNPNTAWKVNLELESVSSKP